VTFFLDNENKLDKSASLHDCQFGHEQNNQQLFCGRKGHEQSSLSVDELLGLLKDHPFFRSVKKKQSLRELE